MTTSKDYGLSADGMMQPCCRRTLMMTAAAAATATRVWRLSQCPMPTAAVWRIRTAAASAGPPPPARPPWTPSSCGLLPGGDCLLDDKPCCLRTGHSSGWPLCIQQPCSEQAAAPWAFILTAFTPFFASQCAFCRLTRITGSDKVKAICIVLVCQRPPEHHIVTGSKDV